MANVIGLSLEDGKISAKDFGLMFNLIDEFSAISGVDWDELKNEFNDFDQEDLEEVGEHFKQKFNIPQDDIEQKVEEIFLVIIKLVDAGIKIYSIVKSFKTK